MLTGSADKEGPWGVGLGCLAGVEWSSVATFALLKAK